MPEFFQASATPGLFCAGNAGDGGVVSTNGGRVVLGPSAGNAQVYTAREIACQYYTPTQLPTLVAVDVFTKAVRELWPHGVNKMVAGAGHWFADKILDGLPVEFNVRAFAGEYMAWFPWNGTGLIIREPTEDNTLSTTLGPEDPIQLFDNGGCVWAEGGIVHSWGLIGFPEHPLTVPGGFGWLKAFKVNSVWWLAYQSYARAAVVAHPADELVGYEWLAPNAFRLDVTTLGALPQLIWSRGDADSPADIQIEDVDVSRPRVPLTVTTQPGQQPPKIEHVEYDPLIKAGVAWGGARFQDRGTTYLVSKDAKDQLHIAADSPDGHDATGVVRQLTVEGPSTPEIPPMAPDITNRFRCSPAIASKDLVQVFDLLPSDCAFGLPIQNIIYDGANQGPNTWQALVEADAYRKLKAAGIPLVIEMGSVKPGDCQIVNALHNLEWAVGVVREHGGDVACISMDEPLTADKDACHQGIAATATLVAQFIQRGRELGVPVGWIEAWPHIDFAIQKEFLLQLKALGTLPAHWHLDIDWNRADHEHQDPAKMIHDAWALATECGVAFGVYVNSTVDPIATDVAHHANVVALAQKIHGLVPDVPQIVLAAWAFRLPNQQGLQDVPNNFGVHGLLRTFDEVRAIFEATPIEEHDMISTLTDPLKEVIAVKAIQPIPGSTAVTWILPNDNVYSCQPDGSYGERPPGTEGVYERNRTNGNIGTFKPADKYISKAYVLVDGL